jgi:hypothetical protein
VLAQFEEARGALAQHLTWLASAAARLKVGPPLRCQRQWRPG